MEFCFRYALGIRGILLRYSWRLRVEKRKRMCRMFSAESWIEEIIKSNSEMSWQRFLLVGLFKSFLSVTKEKMLCVQSSALSF